MKKNKNDSSSNSFRKPLKEVSNNTNSSKPLTKKSKENEDEGLDRLLLVQSDLSSLIHQINELVVQAFKLNESGKQGKKEIESFSSVLSDIHTFLKPWVPRFQKAFSTSAKESEAQIVQSMACKSCPAGKEEKNVEIDSPGQSILNLLVSPSPIVSWRANCTVERNRQTFLLTPLPKSKTLSFKQPDSCISFCDRNGSNTTGDPPSFFSFLENANGQGALVKATPRKTISSKESETGFTLEPSDNVSASIFLEKNDYVLDITPFLKRSPPRSCVLLEPISVFSPRAKKDKFHNRISTPFPVGIKNSDDSEFSSSSSEGTDNLALKYPELIGIQQAHKFGNGKKMVDESLDWFMSPPKTCILMEPPEQKTLGNMANTGVFSQQNNSTLTQNKDFSYLSNKTCSQELFGDSFAVECTPKWKEPESTMRTGKHPGENTLKKELWTRFEAASFDFLGHDIAPMPFTDILDEASCLDEAWK